MKWGSNTKISFCVMPIIIHHYVAHVVPHISHTSFTCCTKHIPHIIHMYHTDTTRVNHMLYHTYPTHHSHVPHIYHTSVTCCTTHLSHIVHMLYHTYSAPGFCVFTFQLPGSYFPQVEILLSFVHEFFLTFLMFRGSN